MNLAARYFIRSDYRERLDPHYFPDANAYGQESQPDVYPFAMRIAEERGVRSVLDLGCGQGGKLDRLHVAHPDWPLTGIDYGLNIAAARDMRVWGQWLDGDLSAPDQRWWRPIARGALVICADVIEHLVDPYPLLYALRLAPLDTVVLSTPERERTWGDDHTGPPPNECHVREWSHDEFADLLEHVGFGEWELSLTRDSDQASSTNTLLAVARP